MTFDTQLWGFDRRAAFQERQSELIRRAAAAPQSKRRYARLNLARFYLARRLSAEAKAVLDVALSDHGGADDVTGSVLRAVADIMLQRPEDALKQLSKPQVGTQLDAAVWRAIALSRQGNWSEARDAFKKAAATIAALPIELQRVAMMEELRTDLELRDFNSGARLVNEFETVGVSPGIARSYAVLVGRLNEGLGRTEDALENYRVAVESSDRRAAAQGRLREIALRASLGEAPRKQTIAALETLTAVWRGDETETEGLKLLAHLYTEEGRYRDAFHVMRTALLAHPNSDLTRKIHDEAAATFDSLFLSHKGDSLPPIEALALFYDYRELTPIGRRGDEMIRRLADRLVAVDLLDQAAELLQHQVDERLQGAARAQVATRLAVIYLMSHKPDRALATLRSSRSADLANELRDQRLLLEARALSDIGRHDLALEIIANIRSREADRLRADILWDAKRWREAAEQIERLYGDRWRQFAPLNASERTDILRAAIGYALSDEAIGLARFRERYAPKMAEGPDSRAFDVVSAPIGTANGEFQSVARRVAAINTLDAFLRDMRERYPETGAASTEVKDAAGPADRAKPRASAPSKAPTGSPKADAVPTGSIARARVSSARR
jgi:tetratricopeptide (TPR) repeat protein